MTTSAHNKHASNEVKMIPDDLTASQEPKQGIMSAATAMTSSKSSKNKTVFTTAHNKH